MAVMKNHTAQAVRNLVAGFIFGLARVRRAMADTMSEVSVGYEQSQLNGPSAHGLGGPAPGERAAPVAGQAPVGAGNVPRFALFATSTEAVAGLLREHKDLLESTVRPPFSDGGMWLVRPDGYVACTAKDGDVATIADYLRGLGRSIETA